MRDWPGRFAIVATLTIVAFLNFGGPARAQSSDVPVQIQAELLAKLVAYDRNFRARAQGVARALVLVKKEVGRSRLAGEAIKSALGKLELVGGLPHDERIVVYEDAAAVRKLCDASRIAIVYVTPGLEDEIETLSRTLAGTSVLTVSPVEEHVSRGIVLGFELVSARTKLVLNLPQAKLQKIDFSAEVLRLMKVRK